ncbi:MAG TPA: Na-translocating system protein MpsB, partial [Pirellulaceae bacterium]|nr:Na-translocating system protein MpsB [Pirellulaceae bacterium]
QMECRSDRVAHGLPPGSLVEFIALRLLLDRLALSHLVSRELGTACDLKRLRSSPLEASSDDQDGRVRCEAFAVFQLAQALGWQPESLFKLPNANWRKLLEEIRLFDEKQRLYVYQLAYERKFRQQCLDAIGTSGRAASIGRLKPSPPDPELDVLTCIDEREESFRRHLEEIDPRCRTWGTAGFFGVAMYYKGADSFQYVPLCPIVIEPQHFVQECVFQDHADANTKRSMVRRIVGRLLHGLHAGSRLLFSGAMASLLGALAALPMVARVLLPRWAGSFRERVGEWFAVPDATYLQVEREDHEPGSINCQTGYTLDEMVAIVERLLRDIGLTQHFARLLVVLGHGSTSLNNPHESAHDCGACGGGRGGPNARAWALMANDARVREQLRAQGLPIPDSTYIVGGYHNTCDDSVTLYDVDRVPASHADALCRARRVFEEACRRNAHERCRRFESAELTLDPSAALRHVRARVEDLSQVRPEYGHATNALCIVGRREMTRHLFLDRRAFLQSYDPAQDDAERSILSRILAAVVPVCAGINLEYYFSYIDPDGYGCGTKLPHNITSLVGVMNGAASDLRPGLPWQMVEIHEPVRLLIIIETTPEIMWSIMARNPLIDRLVRGHWVQLVTWNAEQGEFHRYRQGAFERYVGESADFPLASTSADWYRGWRGDLEFAQIVPTVDHSQALAH